MIREAEHPTVGRQRNRLAGSTVLLTGGSGFLGKAVLAALLAYGDGLERLLVLLRATDAAAAQKRLVEEVLSNEAFADLTEAQVRQRLDGGMLRAVAGDLEVDQLGGFEQDGWGKVDTVINCAASVSFEEPLDDVLALNTFGPARLLDSLHKAGAHPHFVHVSTAYVGDCQAGAVSEDELPRAAATSLDPSAMLEAAQKWRSAIEEESTQPSRRNRLAGAAKHDAAHRPDLDAVARAEELRRRWVREQLAAKGRRYAIATGWPDTYALTKAAGELLLTKRSEHTTVVRPSIIESALHRPYPGWLEGIKVADPLILAYASRGLTHLPGRSTNLIDIVPVDYVANACVAAAAHPTGERLRTLSITSGARNPLAIGELADHIKAHFRRDPLKRKDGAPIAIGDLQFVDRRVALRKTMRRERMASLAAALATSAPASSATMEKWRRTSRLAAQVTRMVKIYGPYTELDCVFDDSNSCALARSLTPADRADLPFDTADIDWKEYLEGIHLPQVHRMAEERSGRPDA